MTLSWWSIERAKGESEESELEEALVDVSWVLSNLVSVLSAGDTEPTSTPTGESQCRSQRSVKVGPPKKRSRVR